MPKAKRYDCLLKITPSKWSLRNLPLSGPFEIESIINTTAVCMKLKLPAFLKIHPTFHVSIHFPFPSLCCDSPSQMIEMTTLPRVEGLCCICSVNIICYLFSVTCCLPWSCTMP